MAIFDMSFPEIALKRSICQLHENKSDNLAIVPHPSRCILKLELKNMSGCPLHAYIAQLGVTLPSCKSSVTQRTWKAFRVEPSVIYARIRPCICRASRYSRVFTCRLRFSFKM